MQKLNRDKQLLSDAKFFSDYSRMKEDGSYETWEDSVNRVMDTHRKKYKNILDSVHANDLNKVMSVITKAYKAKRILGAQRALQFGGDQLLKHETKLYNCASSYADRLEFFEEGMYLLLCGVGIGFSVQQHHIACLPSIQKPLFKEEIFHITDDIEGWSRAFYALIASYTVAPSSFQGKNLIFDYSAIRPKGTMISGGFKAPGSEGIQKSLEACRKLLNRACSEGTQLRPIHVYDYVMHMADAVLSGGVRRSATICLFSPEDTEMMNAKTGTWYIDNPQRGRSNNSVILVRDKVTKEQWDKIIESVKSYGEPGFIFTDSTEFVFNPCVEIGMFPVDLETNKTGWQLCNLTEINGGCVQTSEEFYEACWAASALGTLQAGYTNFKVLTKITKRIVEREALLGVSVTGWMDNPELFKQKEVLKRGAAIVKQANEDVAKIIGINPAARTTCVKPSGNASVILGTASGIHGEHSLRYFRHMQKKANEEVLKVIQEAVPAMIEDQVLGNKDDKVIAFPITVPDHALTKQHLLGVKQLEWVKHVQQYWVNEGKNKDYCTDPRINHNVSNTITVNNWDEVAEYIYNNREHFAGISLLAAAGDKAYIQAPFTEVKDEAELQALYGPAAFFASGLIVDGLHAFDDLWLACDQVFHIKIDENHDTRAVLKKDWIRRVQKFANNYFPSEKIETSINKAIECLKDVYLLHKWHTINRQLQQNYPDFGSLKPKEYVSVDTLAGQACAGGVCEIV